MRERKNEKGRGGQKYMKKPPPPLEKEAKCKKRIKPRNEKIGNRKKERKKKGKGKTTTSRYICAYIYTYRGPIVRRGAEAQQGGEKCTRGGGGRTGVVRRTEFASLVSPPLGRSEPSSSHLFTPFTPPPLSLSLSLFPFLAPHAPSLLPPPPYPHRLIHAKSNHFCCYKMVTHCLLPRAPYYVSVPPPPLPPPSRPPSSFPLSAPVYHATPHHTTPTPLFFSPRPFYIIRRGTTHTPSFSFKSLFVFSALSISHSSLPPPPLKKRAANHASAIQTLLLPLCLCQWRDLSSLLSLPPSSPPPPTDSKNRHPLLPLMTWVSAKQSPLPPSPLTSLNKANTQSPSYK
eukprot:Rhum_TRINITY_DN14943_c9_g1::Rhum_TRINITY_DN14943_c9_g1_i1::g.127401::m.127401